MVRRAPLLLCGTLAVILAGCQGGPTIDEARTAAIVDVDGVTLDGATLESILSTAPPAAGPGQETARLVVSAFIDAALLRKALLDSTILTDSATIARILEPDVIRGIVRQQMIDRANGYPVPTDAQVDSTTRAGQVRSFQVVGLNLVSPDDSVAMAALRAKVNVIRAEAMKGGDFSALVQRFSEDTALTRVKGYLPALQRAQLPPTQAVAALWRLEFDQLGAPLALGNLVVLPRRTKVEEARPAIREWLIPVMAAELNKEYLDSLRAGRKLVLASDAVERMRALVTEPLDGGGKAPLATWTGGELSPDQVRLWVSVLPPANRAVLPGVADSTLTLLLTEVADRYLLRDLTPGGSQLPAEAWTAMVPQLRSAVVALDSAYRPTLAGTDASQATRTFLRGITTGQIPYRPLPGAMVWVLRQGATIRIDQPAIDAIMTAVLPAWNARRDSLAAAESTTAK